MVCRDLSAHGTGTLQNDVVETAALNGGSVSVCKKAEPLRVLLEDLDGPTDPGVDAAWAAEVQRYSRVV